MHKKSKGLKRIENTKSPQGNIYIFCEGEKTECKYFSSFRSEICKGKQTRRKPPQIRVIPSKNCGALSNLEFINGYAKSQSLSEKDGDCIICIIDCDDNKKEDLSKAIKIAKGKTESNKIKINMCLSNPSFEIWYLLHYELYKNPLDQKSLERRLKKHIPNYKKNIDYYSHLKDNKIHAIRNANCLKECHSKKGIKLLSVESNPSTMVPYFLDYVRNFVGEVN